MSGINIALTSPDSTREKLNRLRRDFNNHREIITFTTKGTKKHEKRQIHFIPQAREYEGNEGNEGNEDKT